MERKIRHGSNCIGEVLNFLLFVLFERFIFVAISWPVPDFGRMLLPLAVPLFFYAVRCLVHRFRLFLPLHILPIVFMAMVYGRNLPEKIVFTAAVFIQFWISMTVRIAILTRPERSDYGLRVVPPPPVVIISALLLLIKNETKPAGLLIVYILLYLLYFYLTHYTYYVEVNKRTAAASSVREIFTADFYLVGGFTLISGLIMAAAAGHEYLSGAGAWLMGIIAKVISAMMKLANLLIPPSLVEIAEEADQPREFEAAMPGEVKSRLDRILDLLFNLIGIIILLIIIGAIIYGLFRLIRAAFAKRGPTGLFHETAAGDIVERLERKRRPKRERNGGRFRPPEEQIRRIFRAVMLKRMSADQEAAGEDFARRTAREMQGLFAAEEEAARDFIGLYEKARYAAGNCTAADVRAVRKLARRLNTVKTGTNAYDSGKDLRKL